MNPKIQEKIRQHGLSLAMIQVADGFLWTAGQPLSGSYTGATTWLKMSHCGAGLTPGEAVNSWCEKHNTKELRASRAARRRRAAR